MRRKRDGHDGIPPPYGWRDAEGIEALAPATMEHCANHVASVDEAVGDLHYFRIAILINSCKASRRSLFDFGEMARRIAALMLLAPALDENYRTVKGG